MRVAIFVVAVWTAATASAEAPYFTAVTPSSGINHVQLSGLDVPRGGTMTGGVAIGDYDNDRWPDLFATRMNASDILYRNLGVDQQGNHLGFEDVSVAAFGVPVVAHTNAAAWGDVDNDGWRDLMVTAVDEPRHFFYRNKGVDQNGAHLGFEEVGVASGAAINSGHTHFGWGIAFGDYNLDSRLDMFVAEWRSHEWNPDNADSHTRLLRNDGPAGPGDFTGMFSDQTNNAGVNMQFLAQGTTKSTLAFSPRFTDLNRDGHPDLVVASDFGTSRMFMNNGQNAFVDATNPPIGSDQNGMGSTVGDFNRDGNPDWFVTAIDSNGGNWLYENNGDGTWSDATTAVIRSNGWGWGTSFVDFDNSGSLDIVMTNGWTRVPFDTDPSKLFVNDGAGVFSDPGGAVTGITDTGQGRGLATFDYDKDGDLDVFIVNNRTMPILYRNDIGHMNNWLRVDTVGTQSNRDGIGALITVKPDADDPATWLVQEIDGGSNYLGQNEKIAHFGLGPGAQLPSALNETMMIDELVIQWPSGLVDTYYNVQANHEYTVVEARGFAVVPLPPAVMTGLSLLGFGFLAMRVRSKR